MADTARHGVRIGRGLNPGVSQRSGINFPDRNVLVREKESGLWVHPSEMDVPTHQTGDSVIDNILLNPALPPRYGRMDRAKTIYYTPFQLHLVLEPLIAEFVERLADPANTFFLLTSDVTNPNFTAMQDSIMRTHSLTSQVSFTLGPGDFNGTTKYLYFLIHNSRVWDTTDRFEIDHTGSQGLNQRNVWTQITPNAMLFDESYDVWRTQVELLPTPLLGPDGTATLYFGV